MDRRINPVIRLIFTCQKATLQPNTLLWTIEEPYTIVGLPHGATFPVAIPELTVFAHLTEGQGTFELAAECRQLRDDGTRRTVRMSAIQPVTIRRDHAQSPLYPVEIAFPFKNLPLREEGLYEFFITVDDPMTGGRVELSGDRALLRVIARNEVYHE